MTDPTPRPDEADLRATAAVTCPQDRGEDPFSWSDLPTPEEPLPPYSGDTTECGKCGHPVAFTDYRPATSSSSLPRLNGRRVRGPLPERHLRTCGRCRYEWHEAVGTAPDAPAPLTVKELAYALDNATPYPVDMHPDLAAAIAARLADMVTAYRRPEHPVWEPDVQDARPTPTPMEAP